MADQVSQPYYFPYAPPPPPPSVFIPQPPTSVQSPAQKKRKVEVKTKEKKEREVSESEYEDESEEESEEESGDESEEESGSEEEESEEESEYESDWDSEEESEEEKSEEEDRKKIVNRIRNSASIDVKVERAIKNDDLPTLKKLLENQTEYNAHRLRVLAISYGSKKSILNYIDKKIIDYECVVAIRTENVAYLRSLEKIPMNIRKMLKDSKSKAIKAFVKKYL